MEVSKMSEKGVIYRSAKNQDVPAISPDKTDFTLHLEKGKTIYLTRRGSSGAFFQVEGNNFYLFRPEYEVVYLYENTAVVETVVVAEAVPSKNFPIVR
jgi:hypothetical protein